MKTAFSRMHNFVSRQRVVFATHQNGLQQQACKRDVRTNRRARCSRSSRMGMCFDISSTISRTGSERCTLQDHFVCRYFRLYDPLDAPIYRVIYTSLYWTLYPIDRAGDLFLLLYCDTSISANCLNIVWLIAILLLFYTYKSWFVFCLFSIIYIPVFLRIYPCFSTESRGIACWHGNIAWFEEMERIGSNLYNNYKFLL